MFLWGLLCVAGGGIVLVRLTWLHFGATGLWFLGAYLVFTLGNSLIDAATRDR
jgi:hypothetical protein